MEAWDVGANKPKYVTFYLVTPDEEVYFGQSFKSKADLSLQEYRSALARVRDEELYPRIPTEITLTIASENLDDVSAFIKRPGLNCYETMKRWDYVTKALLGETLIMEQLSKTPHPNIIKYHGCRTRRGRITAIVLERLDLTLELYARTEAFSQLDKEKFMAALESAVSHVHSLGLAHNDINPQNIMVKDGMPVLIDFGSCAPYGTRLQSLGSPGWFEKPFFTSEKDHDSYPLKKLRGWWDRSE